MTRIRRSNIVKGVTIAAGALCLGLALVGLSVQTLSWGFIALAVFATVIAPRLTLQLPGAKFALSFADAAVFLTFSLFGGPAAILMAGMESTATCLLLKHRRFPFGTWMIQTNVSLSLLSITGTYLTSLLVPEVSMANTDASTRHVIVGLGSLALAQFVFSSLAVSLFAWAKNGTNPWTTWRQDCFTSSMTQIVGAGLAGLVFCLVGFGDPVVAVIASVGIACAYVTFRSSIAEVNGAMRQVEIAERKKSDAEREKAETERERREEAEAHAALLRKALEKEEHTNAALRKSERELQHSALHDDLTDLPNRKHFGEMLEYLIKAYKDDPTQPFHVLFMDIRRFKDINDSLGHSVGDKLLVNVASRFVRLLTPKDVIARLGGDEFAVILRDSVSAEVAEQAGRMLRESIARPFSVNGQRISIGINVGIAPCDPEYNSPEEVLRDADIAMHFAKEKGSGVEVFTEDLRTSFLERVRFEKDLRMAIERNELSMHYQLLISLATGLLMGFEALLRWQHSELGNIPPYKFIPIAEESGLIIPITNWILSTTAAQLAEWQKIGPRYRDLMMSINISGKHLSNDDLITEIEKVLAATGLEPSTIKLEITESAAMENAEHTISLLNRLKALGVKLSIDDFGTGHSSLSYLHRLPFDMLKIDRSFVYSVGESGENSEILMSIISLAKTLNKQIIAEGIETEAQLRLLRRLGCDYGQGYLLARPQTRDDAEVMLYQGTNFFPAAFQEEPDAFRAHDVPLLSL